MSQLFGIPSAPSFTGLALDRVLLGARCLALSLTTSLAIGLTLVTTAVSAAEPTAVSAADPALERQVLRISAELRCLVCQNQTVADSNAELAIDLRNQVRDMLKRGQSEAQIVEYMTARYGDFVLYRPPVKSETALLWFGPAVLLVVGVGALVLILRQRSRMAPDRFESDPEDLPS